MTATETDAYNSEPPLNPGQPESLVAKLKDFFCLKLSKVSGFRNRQAQLEMSVAIAESIEQGQNIAIEAGTGTGKSLAYLVPLILLEGSSDGPSVIATKTVQLQDQLLNKDLPTLQNLVQTPRKVVQAKGWSNYVCIRRVENPDEVSIRTLGPALGRIRNLLVRNSGRLTRQEAPLLAHQWERVKADPLDCQKRHCAHFANCGLFAERRELESAEIIVTNHAFLLTDLCLRREGRGLLPNGRVLVIDEAHRLDDVATEHLAIRFDPERSYSCISAPLLSGTDGWLAATRFTFLMALPEIDFLPWSDKFDRIVLLGLKDLEHLTSDLFVELQELSLNQIFKRADLKMVLHSPQGERLANLVSQLCLALEERAKELADLCKDYEEHFEHTAPSELARLAQSISRLGEDLGFLSGCESEDWVFLLEAELQTLIARPVDNAEALQKELFNEYQAVIVTSASLQVGKSFDFFKNRTGFGDQLQLRDFPSPFAIESQTFIGLASEGPEPSEADYPSFLAPLLVRLAVELQGRILVLTTSHRRVKEFVSLLQMPLLEEGIRLLSQGQESPGRLLREFSSLGKHVLIGVDTFWEGVDIPGERLSCVVMTRLPFPVPKDVLFQARAKRIEQNGGNSFRELSMPLVGLKLKQGFGRLLRTENDKGIFLLTDPRGCQRHYGREVLSNLPAKHAVKGPLQNVIDSALEWSRSNLPVPERFD